MKARIFVLRPLEDSAPRELYTPREVAADAGEADRIQLAKLIVAETGMAAGAAIQVAHGRTLPTI